MHVFFMIFGVFVAIKNGLLVQTPESIQPLRTFTVTHTVHGVLQ